MGSREWTYWLVYMSQYPWGNDWEQAALQSWAAFAPHVTKNTPRIVDFLPESMRGEAAAPERMTPEQVRAVLLGPR